MNNRFVVCSLVITIWMSTLFGMPMQASASESIIYTNVNYDELIESHQELEYMYFHSNLDTLNEVLQRHSILLFHKDHELKNNGLEGSTTWAALEKASVSRDELDMLAKIIHGEARGESYEGKVAVGAVIMNRVASSGFPDTVEAVIYSPRAFTAIDDGQYNLKPDPIAYEAALEAIQGYDPTNGALYYFNPDIATSSWIWTRKQVGKIGSHIFAV
ncbi:cell wall hydrolase [Paenibacillus sp. GSMTC-2017]|uniref:cell wall hydrolase n=1 Tax=Paenibacillus sp. GSMTC-2017 TaxID=2794350 RepID=UPI0018D87981|nr:cell wall hydrolase [Paenibacillus sp. GSMTC-2017]MBH5317725.1 cell wall hydrolase [Paenibacillus sp. GSMTC-2017]